MDKNNPRLRAVNVSIPLLIDMLRQGYKSGGLIETVQGVPEDAQFIGAYTDGLSRTVYFVFEHESFDPLPPGRNYPEISVILRTWHDLREA